MRKSVLAVLVALAALSTLAVPAFNAAAQNPPAAAPAPFNPGFADLMTLIVQPRHTKLWYAGRAGNWPLAEYEAKELKTALTNVTRARPRFRDQPTAPMLENFMGAAIATLEGVIKDKSAAKFPEAYAAVNAGCNACHASLDLGFIVIKSPEQFAFPDQEFLPRR